MLYYLSLFMHMDQLEFFRLFKYLTFRAGVAFIATWAFMQLDTTPTVGMLSVPFFKNFVIPFGLAFVVVGGIVIAGAANAVNFTDGLDGLAIVPVMIAGATFLLIAYLVGN